MTKPPSSGPTAAAIAAEAPDQRVRLLAGRALEVAVDERLHRREQQRRAEAADDRPEDHDRGEALGQGHRQGADGIGQQPEDIGALAPDQVADLAADEDERRRDQRLQRDRRLHATDRRVEIVDHRGDRHVHQRRVHDQHEHRRRQSAPGVAEALPGARARRRGHRPPAAAAAGAPAVATGRSRARPHALGDPGGRRRPASRS